MNKNPLKASVDKLVLSYRVLETIVKLKFLDFFARSAMCLRVGSHGR